MKNSLFFTLGLNRYTGYLKIYCQIAIRSFMVTNGYCIKLHSWEKYLKRKLYDHFNTWVYLCACICVITLQNIGEYMPNFYST